MQFSRRTFLAGVAAAGAAMAIPKGSSQAAVRPDSYATLIDLTKCDGCPDKETPACVSSCRSANATKFPEPDPAMLKPYWPQKMFEDWSQKRGMITRLTPYNWTFVQKVTVEENGTTQQIAIPRRCMHCDNPPCVKLCPFGVNKKHPEGMVTIDPFLCFGGAKCRTVCPWDVPQRQAGVGIYTYLDPIPAGGGVMFKCDLCKDRLAVGQNPACIDACPKGAMNIGPRDTIFAQAEALRQKYQGYIYGKDENGGTSTLYVSRVAFDTLNTALLKDAKEPEKVMKLHQPENMLDKHTGMASLALAAPIVGAVGALAATMGKGATSSQEGK